jgi:predicted DNA-binding transcriptional regulator AlpA
MGAAANSRSARTQRSSSRAPPKRGYVARARESDITERFDRLADSILLTEPEVAQVVGHPPNTLKHWRLHGMNKGPKPVRMPSDSIRYRVADVRAWLANISK